MKHLKKCTMRLLSVTLAAVMSLFAVGGSAFATAITYKWGVDRSPADTNDRYGWIGNGSTKFSVDDKVHTDNSWYSIKLDNTDYNCSYVERKYNVEPLTTYKFSAMVKYSGFQLDPNAENKVTGALIEKEYSNSDIGYSTSNQWTFLEYEFTTGKDETTRNLRLQNGRYKGYCKGTAWFSDIKLEKAEMTNSWNILALFFKNVDATVSLNGETKNHKESLTEAKINEINTYCLDKLPTLLSDLSDNKMTVNSIDRFFVDEPVTEKDLSPRKEEGVVTGFCIDTGISKLMHKTFDKYLAQKHYNQIIIFLPIEGIDGGWFGLGGTQYKGAGTAQIDAGWDGQFKNDDRFQGQVAVHEMCHGLEHRSLDLYGNKTPGLHEVLYEYTRLYPNSTVPDYHEIIHQYLSRTLPDGRGVQPLVLNVSSGKYTLVSDDMTTGAGIEPGSSSVAPPAPKNLAVNAIADDALNVTWSTVPKASGYQLALFNDASYNETGSTFNFGSNQNYVNLSPAQKGMYYFDVRTAATVDGKTVYSDWTTLAFTHEGVKVVRGDVDNSGAFDFEDISAAIERFLRNPRIDQRTADALGVVGRDHIEFDDIQNLIVMFLRG